MARPDRADTARRIVVAGATGVIGRALCRLLVADGHEVLGTTRDRTRAQQLAAAGVTPIVVDVFDGPALRDALARRRPDAVIHQLTDLAVYDIGRNARLRTIGTRNLVEAATAAGVEVMVAHSISWVYADGAGPARETDPLDLNAPPPRSVSIGGIVALESAVAQMPRGVVLRYGTLYGPGTWYAADGPIAAGLRERSRPATHAWTSFVHVEDAAGAAREALHWPAGPVNLVDDHPATEDVWMSAMAAAIGAPAPAVSDAAPAGRPVANTRAAELGWRPKHRDWRVQLGR